MAIATTDPRTGEVLRTFDELTDEQVEQAGGLGVRRRLHHHPRLVEEGHVAGALGGGGRGDVVLEEITMYGCGAMERSVPRRMWSSARPGVATTREDIVASAGSRPSMGSLTTRAGGEEMVWQILAGVGRLERDRGARHGRPLASPRGERSSADVRLPVRGGRVPLAVLLAAHRAALRSALREMVSSCTP